MGSIMPHRFGKPLPKGNDKPAGCFEGCMGIVVFMAILYFLIAILVGLL